MMRPVFAIAVMLATGAHAAELRHDVFARPGAEPLKGADDAPVKTLTSPPPTVDWRPELRAIIVGAGGGMVNVEGRILQIGQDIEGFRLAEVHERQATFVKDRVRYTLQLKSIRSADKPAPAAVHATASAPAPAVERRGAGTLKMSDMLSRPPAPDTVALDRSRQ